MVNRNRDRTWSWIFRVFLLGLGKKALSTSKHARFIVVYIGARDGALYIAVLCWYMTVWLCVFVFVCVCETFWLLRMARTEPAKPTAIFDYDRCMGILCLLTNDAHNHSHHAISLCVCLCAMFSHTT